MAAFMSSYHSQTYALLRIVSGFLFAIHGGQKVLSFPIEASPGMPWFITYIAGPIELVGGLLILVGLFTSWAAFISSGLMAAAYWMAHGTKALFPQENQGELAALYCFVFLMISATGSGIWSVDDARK
jgi:putative oxidoreductase